MWSVSSTLFYQGMRISAQIILARLMAPKYFGIFALSMVMMSLGHYLLENGLVIVLIRSKTLNDHEIWTIYVAQQLLALLMMGVLFFATIILVRIYQEVDLYWMSILLGTSLWVDAELTFTKALYARRLEYRFPSIVSIVAVFVSTLAALLCAYLGWGLLALVVQHSLYYWVQWLLLLIRSPKLIRARFDWNYFKNAWLFSGRLMLSGLINTAYESGLTLWIGFFYSPLILGYYAQALKVRDALSQAFLDAINRVSFAYLSRIQNEQERFAMRSKEIMQGSILVLAPVLLGIVSISELLIKVAFTDVWQPMRLILILLAFQACFIPWHKMNLNALLVHGQSDVLLKLEIIKKTINGLIILFVVMFEWELTQALTLLLATNGVSVYLNASYAQSVLKYPFYKQAQHFFAALLPAIVMMVCVYLMSDLISNLIILIVLGVVVYTTLVYLIYRDRIRLIYNSLAESS
jgi:O-antigen/teichoic acid export membrane protein